MMSDICTRLFPDSPVQLARFPRRSIPQIEQEWKACAREDNLASESLFGIIKIRQVAERVHFVVKASKKAA